MKIKKLTESTKRIKFINLNGSRYAKNLTESFKDSQKLADYLLQLKNRWDSQESPIKKPEHAQIMAKYICDILGDYINEVVLRGPTSMYINMDRPFKTISVSSHPGEVEFHYDGGDWFFYMTKECNFISNDCWVENPEAIKGFCEHCIVTKNEHEKEVEEDKKWSTNPITNYKGFYKVDVCGSTMWERSIFFNPDTNEFFETQTMYCDCDGYEHFPKNCCPLYYMPRNKQVEQQFHNARTRTELDFEEVVARN